MKLLKRGDVVELISTGQRVTIAQSQMKNSNVVIIELEDGHQLECVKDLIKPVKESDNGMVSE